MAVVADAGATALVRLGRHSGRRADRPSRVVGPRRFRGLGAVAAGDMIVPLSPPTTSASAGDTVEPPLFSWLLADLA